MKNFHSVYVTAFLCDGRLGASGMIKGEEEIRERRLKEKLAELMQQDFGFTQVLFRYQERKIWRLEHQLKNTMGSIYLERKLASKLWKLGRDFGTDTSQGLRINISLSITFLADLLGAPRETTSRVCRKLAEAGLIRMEKKTIWLPDPQRIVLFYKTGVLKSAVP